MSPDDPRHGEERGYYTHLREKEQACESCTTAHRAAQKRRQIAAMNGTPSWVSPVGTRRRIRALAAIGWRMEDIAEALGYPPTHEPVVSLMRRERITRRLARRTAEAYERLSLTDGPSSRVRCNAKKRGWHPPSAWFGVDIDDPQATPDPGWQETRAHNGSRPKAVLLEDFDWLISQGESPEVAAARLGVALATVEAYQQAQRRAERKAS